MNRTWKENNILQEMSSSRDMIKYRLYAIKDMLLTHLLKIYYYRDSSEAVNHWKKEVCNFLRDVLKVKGKNAYPSFGLLKLNLFPYKDSEFQDYQKLRVEDFNDTYDNLPKIEYDEKALSFCKNYVDWICSELSRRGSVERAEIYNKIDELLEK